MGMRRIFGSMLVIVWLCVIFSFSAKKADSSNEVSLKTGHLIGNIFVWNYEEWTTEKQDQFAENINYMVRKSAHMTEFAILSGALMFTLYGIAIKKRMFIAMAGSVCAASLDEFHQLFVEGRSGQFSDVCIDTIGIFAGILIYCLFKWIFRRKQK